MESDKQVELLVNFWKISGLVLLLALDFLVGFYATFCFLDSRKIQLVPVIMILASNFLYLIITKPHNEA